MGSIDIKVCNLLSVFYCSLLGTDGNLWLRLGSQLKTIETYYEGLVKITWLKSWSPFPFPVSKLETGLKGGIENIAMY